MASGCNAYVPLKKSFRGQIKYRSLSGRTKRRARCRTKCRMCTGRHFMGFTCVTCGRLCGLLIWARNWHLFLCVLLSWRICPRKMTPFYTWPVHMFAITNMSMQYWRQCPSVSEVRATTAQKMRVDEMKRIVWAKWKKKSMSDGLKNLRGYYGFRLSVVKVCGTHESMRTVGPRHAARSGDVHGRLDIRVDVAFAL